MLSSLSTNWSALLVTFSVLSLIGFSVIGIALAVISVVLKGYALWYSARRGEKWWFIALLVVNTVGILELIYLAFVVKKWSKPANNPQ